MVELLQALEGGGRLLRPQRGRPLIERDPQRFWQAVSTLLALALILSLVLD